MMSFRTPPAPSLPPDAPTAVFDDVALYPDVVLVSSQWQRWLQQPVVLPSRVLRVIVTLIGTLIVALAVALAFLFGEHRMEWSPVTISHPSALPVAMAQQVAAADAQAVVQVTVPGGLLGSGWFVTPTEVITNAHVVDHGLANIAAIASPNGLPVSLLLTNHRVITGHVHAIDVQLDLALIVVPAQPEIHPLAFAAPNTAKLGQAIATIGSGEALPGTVTTGVISDPARTTSLRESIAQSVLMQISAPINPGDSGGPVLDAAGHVLGMVTLRPDTLGGRPVQGVAFAIPSGALTASLAQLQATGHAVHPELGVNLLDANPATGPSGLLVQHVIPGSAAAKAGVPVGGIIESIGATKTPSFHTLAEYLWGKHPGQTVTLQVWHQGRMRPYTVRLAQLPGAS